MLESMFTALFVIGPLLYVLNRFGLFDRSNQSHEEVVRSIRRTQEYSLFYRDKDRSDD